MRLPTYISQIGIYMNYRYKTMSDDRINGVEKPYIPQSQRSTHKYAINKVLWVQIIERYLQLIINEIILKGKTFRMPSKLGVLQLVKFKGGGVDHVKTKRLHKQGKLTGSNVARYSNIHTDGYGFKLKWYRSTHAHFKYKNLYKVVFTNTTRKYVSSYFKQNPKEVYKLSDL